MTTELIPAAGPPLARRLRDEKLPPPAERRALRAAAGATQQDIADELGVSNAVVSCWERGICTPGRRNRIRYLALLRDFRQIAHEVDTDRPGGEIVARPLPHVVAEARSASASDEVADREPPK